MQANTYQHISRVKDPNGIEKSLVFCLGVNEQEVFNFCTWGYNRDLDLEQKSNGYIKTVNVKCSHTLPMPKVAIAGSINEKIRTALTFTQIIQPQSASYTDFSTSVTANEHTLYNTNRCVNFSVDSASALQKTTICARQKCDFSTSVTSRIENNSITKMITDIVFDCSDKFVEVVDLYAENENERFNPVPSINIARHLSGEREYGMHLINNQNETTCILFRVADKDCDKIEGELNKQGVPFFLEECENDCKIWVLMKPIDTKIAHEWGESIMSELKLKGWVLPIDNHPVKLPGGRGCTVWMGNRSLCDNVEKTHDWNIWKV
jgi:hypothetical protein